MKTADAQSSLALTALRFEALDKTGSYGLRRGFDDQMRGRVLLSVAAQDAQLTQVMAQFDQCVAISSELDPALYVRSLSVQAHDGRPALVMHDPGGELLSTILERPVELRFALQVAADVAASLADFHARGFLHRDVKPSNILVDPMTGRARLAGFRLALRLPRHRQAPEAPARLAGTLAYMAPERSGWTNRSTDNRSDLYSLGVVLYEMVTGRPPFVATDLAEWMHCHVARRPPAPDEVDRAMPGVVSAIVMRLLAKNPEERYQTAHGLEADLRRCLSEMTPGERAPSFPLGSRDVAQRLAVPEKLYGRDQQIAALLDGFEHAVAERRARLLLVAGPSGIGKSSVVAELYKAIVPVRGRFVSGKCDQYKRDVPYAALGQALAQLVSSLLGESESELTRWRSIILEAVADGGALVAELIPELGLIIGAPLPPTALPAHETQALFQAVLRRLLSVFSGPGHPLVLFLDDLQWLDVATMDLLGHILGHDEGGSLLLIGAYRDNEIGPEHPFRPRLEELLTRPTVGRITLPPLTLDDLTELVADTTQRAARDAAPLAALVLDKTGGNPFFTVQFVDGLGEGEMITLDPRTSEWRWDLRELVAASFERDVLDLMLAKFARFARSTREACQTLAAFGAVATSEVLAELLDTDAEQVDAAMHDAVRAGLLHRSDRSVYGFAHDSVQEAAYALIPEDQRPQIHLRLGRLLARGAAKTERVFEIVHQLNRATSLLTTPAERHELAALNTTAGRRAHAAAAFDVALTFFIRATELLTDEGWTTQRDLTFEAEYFRAECEFLNGETDTADELLASLGPRTAGATEEMKVLCLRLVISTCVVRYQDALDMGLAYFHRALPSWPVEVGETDIDRELRRTRALLGERSIASLVDLPAMTDPEQIALMEMFAAVHVPAMFSNAAAHGLVVARAVNLSLERGLSDMAPLFFGLFGIMMMDVTKRQDAGREWAKLALAVVEERGFRRARAKAYVVAGHILVWTEDLAIDGQLGARGLQASIETGDFNYANAAYVEMCRNELARGTPLASAERLVLNGLAFSAKLRNGLMSSFQYQLNVIRALRGGAFDFAPYADEASLEEALERDGFAMILLFNQVRVLERNVYLGRPSEAVRAAERAEKALGYGTYQFEYAELQFYGGIARAMAHDSAEPAGRAPLHEAVRRHAALLREWGGALRSSTFAHRHRLVEAELARIEERPWDALCHYEESIRLAREHGWAHHEALANERAGRFFSSRGFGAAAQTYLASAHRGYLQWGALAKARLLEPALAPGVSVDRAPTVEAPVEQLALDTVLKVSSALSGEMVLGALTEKLLTIAMEQAGAGRALLLLSGDGEPRVVAEAISTSDGIEVRSQGPHSASYPRSMIRWVLRTRKPLVVVDPEDFAPFSADAYLRGDAPRSVVVLPLAKQTAPLGVLYLENRLAGSVFGEARLSVLKLVAAQAGIALDNARLYEELRRALDAVHRSEEQLRTTLDAVPEVTWYNRPDGGAEFQSAVWRELTGLSIEESKDYGWLVVVHPDDRATLIEQWDRIRASGQAGEVEARIRRRDGVYRWVVFRARPRRDDNGEIVRWYGNTVDIEDRKRAELELDSRLRYVTMLSEISAAFSSGADERIRAALGQVGSFFGLDAVTIWWPATDRRGGEPLHHWSRTSGRAWPTERNETDAAVLPLVVGGATVATMRFSCGPEREWPEEEWSRIRIVGEIFASTFGRFHALKELERSEASLQSARAKLDHAARVATLGELAASIAHEVNQPLAAIVSDAAAALNWLSADGQDLAKVDRSLHAIVREGGRAGEVLTRVRALISRTDVERTPCDVGALVEGALSLVRGQLEREGIRLEVALSAAGARVMGYTIELQQVVLNLVLNAADAVRESAHGARCITVRSTIEHASSGPAVVVAVEDNGTGIGDDAARLFDMFYTTKAGGLGMGLSISQSSVQRHAGRLWAESNARGGATFSFSLPLAAP